MRCTPGSSLPMSSPRALGGALTAPIMRVADLVDAQVTGPSVGDHGGPWGDVVGDERVQRAGRPIGNDAHPTSPKTLGRPYFHGYRDQRLLALGPAAGQPGLLATDVGLVDLHLPGQQFSAGPGQH